MPLSPRYYSSWVCALALALILPLGASAQPAAIAPEPSADGTASPEPPAPESLGLPAREWRLEPTHSALLFSVSHLGFSRFTAGFDSFDATLTLDPEAPEAAELTATVDIASLDLPGSAPDFLAELLSPNWLDAETQPQMVFTSTEIRRTGSHTAEAEGILSLRGTEAPVTLAVRFNGGYPSSPFEPYARIGFSATAELSRSAFGMGFGVPAPGTTFGVGDTVALLIEAEFIADPVAPE